MDRFVLDKNRLRMMKEEQTSEPVSEKTCSDDEIEPLTGKPFFDIVLCKSHVFPSYHIVRLSS